MTETTWERKRDCISDHKEDIPWGHSGANDQLGTHIYKRHYNDGCVEIRTWKENRKKL